MRASSKRPKVKLSSVAPPPSYTGDATAEKPVDPAVDAAIDVPSPSTSDEPQSKNK